MTRPAILDRLEALPKARQAAPGRWAASCPGPSHDDGDEHPSFGWAIGADGRVLVKCLAGCSTDAIVEAVGATMADLFVPKERTRRDPAIVSTRRYEVRDAAGDLVAIHERTDLATGGKRFAWRRPDGRAGLGGRAVASLPLYGAERLAAWPSERVVFAVEGEKTADAVVAAGRFAVATVTGAAGTPDPAVLDSLRGRRVFLAPDHDDAGRSHMARIAALLAPVAAEVRWLDPPADAPPGWDLADAFVDGRDPDEVARELAAGLRDVPTSARTNPARALGDVLDEVEAFVSRFVVLPPGAGTVATLWIAHTHALDAAYTTPYLGILSPAKRSGKTLLLELLAMLAEGDLPVLVTPSAASIFQVLSAEVDHRPALLIDELDTVWNDDGEGADLLRGVLNAGYRRGAVVLRGDRDGKHVRRYDVFGPKALAANGRLPDTIADRSIVLRMVRRLRSEPVERFRRRRVEAEAAALRDDLRAALAARPPAETADVPDELSDRSADAWEPLCAIADAAGGRWPALARQVAVALSGDDLDDDALGIRLLADVRTVFRDEGDPDRLTTAVLLRALVDLDEAPWADLPGRGVSGLRARRLGRLLRPFGIGSGTIRVATGTSKGYYRSAFEEPWRRYLPDSGDYARTPSGAVTPSHEHEGGDAVTVLGGIHAQTVDTVDEAAAAAFAALDDWRPDADGWWPIFDVADAAAVPVEAMTAALRRGVGTRYAFRPGTGPGEVDAWRPIRPPTRGGPS